jgi:hypothetical protein
MTRWRLILLTLALVGALAAVVGRRAAEPDRPDLSAWDEFDKFVAEPVPEVVILRKLAKGHIARETAAGARPLVRAAALFRELNRYPPAVVPLDHPSLRGRTEEERLCRQVILFVTNWDDDEPEVVAAASRLEAELQEELCRHGTVQLPDPAGLPSAVELLEQARARMTEAERRVYFPARRGDSRGR